MKVFGSLALVFLLTVILGASVGLPSHAGMLHEAADLTDTTSKSKLFKRSGSGRTLADTGRFRAPRTLPPLGKSGNGLGNKRGSWNAGTQGQGGLRSKGTTNTDTTTSAGTPKP